MNEKFETLGQLIDELESYSCALELTLPNEMHVLALRTNLPTLVRKFKDSFIEITGENPWD